MNKYVKKVISVALAGMFTFSLASCSNNAPSNESDIKSLFSDTSKISFSNDYTKLKADKRNKTKSWRQGMVSGNGLQGFITSGSPYSDTFIFQNMHFIMPNENQRTCPKTFDELETVKQSIVKGKDITDDASYDDVYRYHPGGQLRLNFDEENDKKYVRYTDYETSQVGVKFTDKNGTWTRTSFTSMADGVVVTKLDKSSTGTKLNLTLSFDDLSSMANFGDSDENNMKYTKVTDDNASYLSLVAHYPNYEKSELKNGGYATVTYVITNGGSKEKVTIDKNIDESQFCGENSGIKITDADSVYLLTVSERTYDMGDINDFENQKAFELVNNCVSTLKNVAEKYNDKSGFNYDLALENHLAIYQPQFDNVTLTLGEDNFDSNEKLLKEQKGKKEINSALAQRTYYAGRYAYLCCAGYSTSRLYGMWTGEFNTGWGSKYTMDANVNLQTSSMNTSNLSSAPIGYAYFILRQLPDWEENAYATHGFKNAIQAPVNTDGDKAVITETCYPYPFRYWNAGTSWMINPLYETLLSYGNINIPLSNEFNLDKLKSVLSITDKELTNTQIKEIKDRGYLRLEEDILYPLLVKSANYWSQLMTPEYYTSKDGSIHYEKGKTQLNDGETYCILPSYSPENNPSNYPSPSDANCAIDISACRDNIEMLVKVMGDVDPTADTSKWTQLENNLPPYLYDETGALKEWATTSFEENNEHRHLSHLYGVWPLFETQGNEKLAKACEQAIANRESENEASHALVHRSLIAARLKDSSSLTDALVNLMNHKIRYDSLMTNHDYDQGSCYCTDFAIGYLGIINEALVYSHNSDIELLPALPDSGFESGTLSGIKTRNRATVTKLEWSDSGKSVSAVITSDIDQTLNISSNGTSQTVEFKAGESKSITF